MSKATIMLDKQLKASGLTLTLQEFTFIKSALILVFLSLGIVLLSAVAAERFAAVLGHADHGEHTVLRNQLFFSPPA